MGVCEIFVETLSRYCSCSDLIDANADPLMDIAFTYGPNSNITAMTDNLRPDRSQTFSYDPVSRFTDASGGYGDMVLGYSAVGDRTSNSWRRRPRMTAARSSSLRTIHMIKRRPA